jgi:hypothetical protein
MILHNCRTAFVSAADEMPGPGEPLRPATIIKNNMPWRLNYEKSGDLSAIGLQLLEIARRTLRR